MASPLFPLEPAPALFHDLLVEPEEARSILRPQRDEAYGFGYALSPYRGCGHGCRYCYARDYPQPVPGGGPGDLHGRDAWGTWAVPKLNAPELLWSQRHRLHQQKVFMASATDPYQPLEREYRLTRACLEVLLQCPTTRVIVHTRSPLALQDLELFRAFGERLSVGFSIPTDDDTVRQVVEPKAPSIPSRWLAVERLARAGIAVTVAATPLLAMEDPEVFARRARASGARGAWSGGLRLLKDDPFRDLLAGHGWLYVLDPEYQDSVRLALVRSFPPEPGAARRDRSRGRGEGPGSRRGPAALQALQGPRGRALPVPRQPGLFEGL
jgi:DNA repair photolyase